MTFYEMSLADVYAHTGARPEGITTHQATERLNKFGPNRLLIQGVPWWKRLIEPFWSVFVLVLALAAAVSLYNHETLDAVIIVSTILVNAAIYYVQEFSTERVLRALRRYSQQSVTVKRDGHLVAVPAIELVPGDVILVHEGDKLPADLRVVRADSLRVDESMLTGESEPVSKRAVGLTGKKEVYEQVNMLFSGSFVLAGEGEGVVVATGNSTEFGRIAKLSSPDAIGTSPVQAKIDRLVTQIIIAVSVVSAVVFALSVVRGMEVSEALRFALSLAVSAVPEGLPVAITVVLVLGMRRMARQRALVRSMRAIEDVGLVTLIATDKTGTLTRNRLRVFDEWRPDSGSHRRDLAAAAVRAQNGGQGDLHDPLDLALARYADDLIVPRPEGELVQVLPFDTAIAMSGNVWREGRRYRVSLKGSPEAILNLCRPAKAVKLAVGEAVSAMAGRGLRVIALADCDASRPVPDLAHLPARGWHLRGLVALADELRPEAARAVKQAQQAGMTVVMITGDHADTAWTIARQLGLASHRSQVVDSRQLAEASDEELSELASGARVFARVVPESKYRILELYKGRHITAMTGDGVNDVPALTKADVGVAMGSGSQLAREAGDIVLLDDNFSSLISAVREGRVIVGNVRKMLVYLLTTNTGEVLTMIGALIAGWPLPVVAVQILWVNLATDTSLVIPLGVEPGDRGVMKQPPRQADAPILDPALILRIIIMAFTMAGLTLAVFWYFLQHHSLEYARTMAFCVLVICQWSNALAARSETRSGLKMLGVRSWPFWLGLSAAILLQWVALGPLAVALHTVPVAWSDLAGAAVLAVVVPLVVADGLKLGRRYTRG